MFKNTGIIIDSDIQVLHIDMKKYADKIDSVLKVLGIDTKTDINPCPPYSKKFQKKLDKSIKEAENGQVTRIDVENIWK
jgi:hypothetical protein